MTTKHVPPASEPTEELVEMEAMDVDEWEKEQHTPVATDAKLAALVKQSAETPPLPPAVHKNQTVARVVAKAPPPTPPTGTPREIVRFGSPAPLKPGDPNPFDGPTIRNAGAELAPKRSDAATPVGGAPIARAAPRSMVATPAGGTQTTPSTTNRHTTSRTATPPAGTPAITRTATPPSRAATPAAGTPTSGARNAAAPRDLATPAGGTPASGRAADPARTPPAGMPVVSAKHTQAIGAIEKAPATPPAGMPVVSAKHTQAIGAIDKAPAPPRTQTPPAGTPVAKPTSTPSGGVPAVGAKHTQAIGAIDKAPAPPRTQTPPAGTPVAKPTSTPAGGVPAVGAKQTQAIGAVDRAPAPPRTQTPPAGTPVGKPTSTPSGGTPAVKAVVGPAAESEGWSLPDDFDEVAAQEWKSAPVPARPSEPEPARRTPAPFAAVAAPSPFAPEPTASSARALPAAAAPSPFAPEPTASSARALPPAAAPSAPARHPDFADEEPSVSVSADLFAPESTAAEAAGISSPAAFAPEPTASQAPRPPQVQLPTAPQPFMTQSSVQSHSQPMHVVQAPTPIARQPQPMPMPMPMPMPVPPPPSAGEPIAPSPMFDGSQRSRGETTDSHRVVSGSKKPLLIIGGAVGAVALVVVIALAMRTKDAPKIADKPAKPTPGRVDPVAVPPPTDVVAVATPDAAPEPSPEDPIASPPTNPRTTDPGTTPPTTGNPRVRTPKTINPKIRTNRTPAIETGKGTPDPVGTSADGDKGAKARAAYSAGNQKLFAGDADGAILAYRQVIAMGSTSGYRGLGLAYAQQGDTANAIAAFKRYVQLSPNAKDVPLIKKRIAALGGK